MKNQYFGDQNDYFKYDFLIFLAGASQLAGIQRLSVVWMLTENDGSRDGQKINYGQGTGNGVLYKFLQKALNAGIRDVSKMEDYFRKDEHQFRYCSYGAEQYFTHQSRAEYFGSIPNENLDDAVIFLDPDNGLETKTTGDQNGHKYITTDEVGQIYGRMGHNSVLAIYQHLPRKHRKLFFYSTFHHLVEKLGCPIPVSISDNIIAFILLTKGRKQQTRVQQALHEYTRSHLAIFD